MSKRTVAQSVFDSPAALRIAKQATHEAGVELERQHRAGVFDEGDPNHPKYNNGSNYATGLPVSLFGEAPTTFLRRQYIRRTK